jgi:hypothetical protein
MAVAVRRSRLSDRRDFGHGRRLPAPFQTTTFAGVRRFIDRWLDDDTPTPVLG